MMESRNGLAPFGDIVLESIVLLHNKTDIPLDGEGSMQGALVQFLNDRGYVDINGRNVTLSPKGRHLYETLLDKVCEDIDVRPYKTPEEPTL